MVGHVQLLKVIPYDQQLYTQGIEKLSKDRLLISAGRYGYSKVLTYHLCDATFQTQLTFSDDYFAEGLTILKNDTFWLLSFKENIARQYCLDDFSKLQEVPYKGQGWGIAYDASRHCLWMTDGSHILQKRHPDSFALLDEIAVEVDHIPISRLNELEYVDGYLYANIWQTTKIVKLEPQKGSIVQVYDLSDILQKLHLDKTHYPDIDVLNGIAHLKHNRFLVTGKLFPLMLEVTLD